MTRELIILRQPCVGQAQGQLTDKRDPCASLHITSLLKRRGPPCLPFVSEYVAAALGSYADFQPDMTQSTQISETALCRSGARALVDNGDLCENLHIASGLIRAATTPHPPSLVSEYVAAYH